MRAAEVRGRPRDGDGASDPESGADGWIRWQASLCMSWGWPLLLIAAKNEVTRICSPSQQRDGANSAEMGILAERETWSREK